jgi:hypothetical protein
MLQSRSSSLFSVYEKESLNCQVHYMAVAPDSTGLGFPVDALLLEIIAE